MTDNDYPPAAFQFAVSLDADAVPARIDGSFQEVSGIGSELDTEVVAEGGENRFVYQLPKAIKHSRLILKRGLVTTKSPLLAWTKRTLEGDLATKVQTRTILVSLLDQAGAPLRVWSFGGAYPVHWEVEAFAATTDRVAIEKLELAYATMSRAL